MSQLVTTKRAGEILGGEKPIPESTMRFWRHSKIGPKWYPIGRHVRYRVEDLEAYLESCARAGGTNRVEAA